MTNVNLDAINDTIKSLQDLRKTLMTQAQEGIKLAFEQFLTAFPQVKTIVWTQYTSYFNDGDECEFSVNTPLFSPVNADNYEVYLPYGFEEFEGELRPFETYQKWSYKTVPNPNYRKYSWENSPTIEVRDQPLGYEDDRMTPELEKAMKSLSDTLVTIDMEDAMRHAFGNHVWVKAYLKDGKVVFDVNDYDHD